MYVADKNRKKAGDAAEIRSKVGSRRINIGPKPTPTAAQGKAATPATNLMRNTIGVAVPSGSSAAVPSNSRATTGSAKSGALLAGTPIGVSSGPGRGPLAMSKGSPLKTKRGMDIKPSTSGPGPLGKLSATSNNSQTVIPHLSRTPSSRSEDSTPSGGNASNPDDQKNAVRRELSKEILGTAAEVYDDDGYLLQAGLGTLGETAVGLQRSKGKRPSKDRIEIRSQSKEEMWQQRMRDQKDAALFGDRDDRGPVDRERLREHTIEKIMGEDPVRNAYGSDGSLKVAVASVTMRQSKKRAAVYTLYHLPLICRFGHRSGPRE